MSNVRAFVTAFTYHISVTLMRHIFGWVATVLHFQVSFSGFLLIKSFVVVHYVVYGKDALQK